MAISPVSCNYSNNAVAFKGREPKLVDVIKHENFEERKYETEASTGKKWGVGIASGGVPGLGQAINGQWGKAIGFGVGGFAGYAISNLMGLKGNFIGAAVSSLGLLGLCIWSIVDAVKNAKSTATEIISYKDDNKAAEPVVDVAA